YRFNASAPPSTCTLSLHDALPTSGASFDKPPARSTLEDLLASCGTSSSPDGGRAAGRLTKSYGMPPVTDCQARDASAPVDSGSGVRAVNGSASRTAGCSSSRTSDAVGECLPGGRV